MRNRLLGIILTFVLVGAAMLPAANAFADLGSCLGAWQYETPLDTQPPDKASFYANGHVYVVYPDHYVYAPVNPVNGSLGAWIQDNSPTPLDALGIYTHYAVTYSNEHVYLAGGISGFDTAHAEVWKCEINPDHTLGAWQQMQSMTQPRFQLSIVVGGGYLYALGGASSNSGFLNSVEYAAINPDGTLQPWSVTSSMTVARPSVGVAYHNGYVYALGGGRHSLRNDSVEAAPVNPDGSLGLWAVVNHMSTYRSALVAVVIDDCLYAIGGYTGTYGDGATNTVEVATIQSSGTLGGWALTTPMDTARCHLSVAVDGCHIYAVGGGVLTVEHTCSCEPCPPVPELPIVFMMSVGLVVLGGYIWFRRKQATIT